MHQLNKEIIIDLFYFGGSVYSPVNLGFCIKQIAIELFSMENGSLGWPK
jgi:hypothetical protein